MPGRTQEGKGSTEGETDETKPEKKPEKKPVEESDFGEVGQSLAMPDSGASPDSAVSNEGVEAPAPEQSRPTRLTPGSGLLAALLAEKRANSGGAKNFESGPIAAGNSEEDRVTPVGAAFDALEVTAVGSSAGGKQWEPDQVKGSGVVRPTRVTPGSGRLAALLAQTRAETAKTEPTDRSAAAIVASQFKEQIGAVTDTPEVTEVDEATGERTTDRKPEPGAQGVASGPRPTRITPAGGGLTALLASTRSRIGKPDIHERNTPIFSADVINISNGRVVAVDSVEVTESYLDASGVQKKNPGFAATLLGVLAPVVDPSGRVDLSNEKNAISRDTSEAATFGERVSPQVTPDADQRPFSLDITGEVKPPRRSRFVVGLVVGTAMVVAVVLLIVPRNRARFEPSQQTAIVPRSDEAVAGQARMEHVLPPAPSAQAADPLAGFNSKAGQPGAVPAAAADPGVAPPVGTSPTDRPTLPSGSTEAPAEKIEAKIEARTESKGEGKTAETTKGKTQGNTQGNTGEKIEGKTADKTDGKFAEKTAEKTTEKTDGKSVRKSTLRSDPSAGVSEENSSPELGYRELSRQAEVRKAAAKAKRKTELIRAADEFVRGPSAAEQARPKIKASSSARPAGDDPDAVLPLSRH